MGKRRRWGTVTQIRREFAELRERQESERKRKDVRREVRATLKRIEGRPAA